MFLRHLGEGGIVSLVEGVHLIWGGHILVKRSSVGFIEKIE